MSASHPTARTPAGPVSPGVGVFMRLPFLQLDSGFIAHRAPTVAALLGCSRAQAIGHLACLWSWALSQGPADAPPTGLIIGPNAARVLRAAAEWEGEPQMLLDVLQDPTVGLVEVVDGGFRIRGMERYARAWEKSESSRARAEKSRERARTVRERNTDVRAKTETYTQTEKKISSPEPSGPGEADDLPQADEHATAVDPENDTPPGRILEAVAAPTSHEARPALVLVPAESASKPLRAPSAQETLYANMQADRQAQCEQAGRAFVDDGWKPQVINKTLGPIVKAIAGDQERFTAGWLAYLDDPYPGGLDLPWSITVFLRQRARYESKAANAAGGVS
jgi:hypothetical protein